MAVKLLGKSALFFELDGAVRKIKPERVESYLAQYNEIPPAPAALGDQTLIEPVVAFIKDYCSREAVIPIGIDQAPYVGPVVDRESYLTILEELHGMLAEAGVPMPEFRKAFFVCTHAPDIQKHVAPDGKLVELATPRCSCRFPGADIFKRAAERHHINYLEKWGRWRFFEPSLCLVATKAARDAAIHGCGLNVQWVEGVLDGSYQWPTLIENEHRTAAARLADFARQSGLYSQSAPVVTADARSLPDLPVLPRKLDRPSRKDQP